jgi:CheY-like chemotaxis protein
VGDRESSYGVIMVADDNECNREILKVFLSFNGYEVIEARNGVEAVAIASKERPDLIIMDLSMPVMDGYGAVRILRELPEVSTIPIVAFTAHDTSTHRVEAMKVGFNEFLTKPIDFCQLNFVINRLLKAA